MGSEQSCCASCVRLLLKSWSTVLAVGLAECGVAMCGAEHALKPRRDMRLYLVRINLPSAVTLRR